MAPEVHRVAVGDGYLHVNSAGEGLPVVMLHGWTLDHRSWLPQLPLAVGARLVMPDRRGFGRSTAPPDLAGEWRDIDKLAGPDRFVLVGFSQGASVALDYARRRPERVAGLVLAGAPLHGVVPYDSDSESIPIALYAEQVRAGQLAAVKAHWAASPLVRAGDAARPLVSAMLDDYDGRDLLDEPGAIAIGAGAVAALSMPLLALAGSDDTAWRRRVAAFLGATAPRGRFEAVDAAGHLCNLDNAARFNTLLAAFLDTVVRQ